MLCINDLNDAWQRLKRGEIIAYPTEAVYGLGCDPFNQTAVLRLLDLKQRSIDKGLILLIAEWAQLPALIESKSSIQFDAIKASWPGPVTWLFPKSKAIPYWLSGSHDTIAIRMSAHSTAKQLASKAPLVSTSANVSGQEPARSLADLALQFPSGIDAFFEGDLGCQTQPSRIIDACSGECFR